MIPVETLEASVATRSADTRLVALAAPESIAAEQYRVLLQRLDRPAARARGARRARGAAGPPRRAASAARPSPR